MPALQASRTTIVHHKQRLARGRRRPFWQILYLDVLLVAIAGYGLYRLRARTELVELANLEAAELALDPVLLFVSTIFVVGLGLPVPPRLSVLRPASLSGRIAPLVAGGLRLAHSGRTRGGKDQFLMLFIILSISIGVYNADAARTLNQNVEERLRYNIGADVVLQEEWRQISDSGSVIVEGGGAPPPGFAAEESEGRYQEPPFRRFEELPGVAQATPVFYEPDASGREFGGDSFSRIALFGIRPREFGEVGWFRSDLLPTHWYHYLNLLSESPAAALISRGLAEESDLEPGDPIYLTWKDQPATLYYVYGIVDYWPGYNPYEARFGTGSVTSPSSI